MNTSFVRDGEVSIPLSYVTGTLVKPGQGIERHLSGGVAAAWLGYFLLYVSFLAGATIGGCIGLVLNGSAMLAVAAAGCALTTGYTYCHADRRVLLEASGRRDLGRSLPRIIRRGRSRRTPEPPTLITRRRVQRCRRVPGPTAFGTHPRRGRGWSP